MVEPIDFSKTQRLVLVIDLHPLLAFQNRNPNPYLTTILAATKRLLTFAPLSNLLFAFKLFFSSLSLLRSASEVHRLLPNPILTSLSFNDYCQTLTSLTTILNTLSTSQISKQLSDARPRASHAASSLLQLVHDYAWESESNNFRGKEKERLTVRNDAQGEVIESLLPMVDKFERAKQHIKLETEQEKKVDASYQGIYKQFVEIMKSLRVAVMPTIGCREVMFCPNICAEIKIQTVISGNCGCKL